MNAPLDTALPLDPEAMAEQIARAQAQADSQLLAAIGSFESSAIGGDSDQLNADRALMLDYYMGQPFGNEVEGRSKYVSRDVYDTVEWIMPSLMRIFAGGERVVDFEPHGEEDVEAAKQEAEYTDYVVQRKNPWFMIAHEWIKDALLTRNAYACAWWATHEAPSIERYHGLPDDQMVMISMDPEVAIISHNAYLAPAPMDPLMGLAMMSQGMPPPPPITFHDIEVRRKRNYGCTKIAALPPEQCLVAGDAVGMSVRNSSFFEFWDDVTISSIREDGFEVPDDVSDAGTDSNELAIARDAATDSERYLARQKSQSIDPSMRKVRRRWIWLKHDYDGDGWAETRYVCVVGRHILYNREVSGIPVACIVPNPMPHRHVGLTIWDAISDLQEIKSSMLREVFNNVHLANNGRYGVDKNLVNLDDMAVSRPGGQVRVNGSPHTAIMPFGHPVNAQQGIAVVEYLDGIRQDRGGSAKPFAGADVNAIMAQPGTIAQLTTAASQKIELIARVIGEGVKELFSIVHEVTLTNATVPDKVRLSGKWVTVDPRAWKRRQDMTLAVGFGLGNRAQQAAAAQALLGMQKEAAGAGLTTPAKVYNGYAEFVKALGYPSAEQFFREPAPDQPFPSAPPYQVQVAQINSTAEAVVQGMKNTGAAGIAQMKEEAASIRTYFETMVDSQNQAQERFLRAVSEATERMTELRLAGAGSPTGPLVNVDMTKISDSIKGAQETIDKTQRGTTDALAGISAAAKTLSEAAEKAERATKGRRRKIKAPSGKEYRVDEDGSITTPSGKTYKVEDED